MRGLQHWRGASLAAGVLLAGLAAACQPKQQEAPRVIYNGPLIETNNVVTLLSDSARLHIRLTAPLEQRFENSDILYPKGVTVTFYDKMGKLIINTLVARWGKFDSAKQLYIMRGAVKVANVPQQQTLNTEELFYNRSQQKIYTDSAMFVRVQTPTEVLTGYGLTANQDFSRYGILRPEGTFSIDQAQTLGK
ncbi:LPS export ABC transporter periplasmic protein LptC [Hymenobacter cheonanensis]|uniref:LPS export ABC transporter periplasmic protein LptC n=1 Tax=Hymenobacter sp. CA2-7 TaxID=3063993 RepID=UPI002712A401|nr:LPS export ABC transporter periplasmic protein LptC [Hymenobacter sp. CA2-7]MDO7884845.1 LPS export ABC transporter periplasmic protein LptC [Hymenobacter sp. CA2-7]